MDTRTITTVTNDFTGYRRTIRTNGLPAVSTVKRHVGASRARDCKSETIIRINGVRHSLENFGKGLFLWAIE